MTIGNDIFTLALDLPPRERAELVRRLLLSLETPPDFDPDAEELWAAEIDRRVAAAELDDSTAVDWRPAIERIRKHLRDEQRP